MTSRRVNAVSPSATLRISEAAKQLRREGKPVVDMSVGEPDFPTPSFIIEAAYRAMKEGKVFYTPSRGIPELLEAISWKLKEENGIDFSPEDIITTPGAKYAIFEAVMSLVDEGDEVILLDPSWVTYEACVLMAGGKVIWVPHTENFQDAPVEDYITEKTRMIIFNSPNNPLGVVYPDSFLKKLRDLAIDHDIFVMSDEIYEKIIFDGEHKSIASMDGMLERTILINGLSKTYSMTGWRIGYAAAREDIIKAMARMQSHSVSHPTSFVQYAAVEAIKGDQGFIEEMVAEFKARRDILMEGLDKLGIKYAPPQGAFYIFMDVGENSMDFSERFLKEKYVATTPGAAFGKSYGSWVRVSYATSRENIQEMLGRLEDFIS